MNWIPGVPTDFGAYPFFLLSMAIPAITLASVFIFYYILHHAFSLGGNKKVQWWLFLLGTAAIATSYAYYQVLLRAEYSDYLIWFAARIFIGVAILFWLLSLLLKSRSRHAKPIPTQKGMPW